MAKKSLFVSMVVALCSISVAQQIYIEPQKTSALQQSSFYTVRFSPAGNLVVLTSLEKKIHIINPNSLTDEHSFTTKFGRNIAVAFTADEKLLLVGEVDGSVSVWNIADTTRVSSFTAHNGVIVRSLDITSTGKIITGGDKETKLWQIGANSLLGSFPKNKFEVQLVTMSPNGRFAASVTSDGTIHILDLATFTVILTLTGNGKRVSSLQFSPDGKLLAAGCSDSTIRIINARDFSLQHKINVSEGNVTSVSFNSTSTWLASANGIIQIWNVQSGKLESTIADSGMFYNIISFSPTNSILLAATTKGSVKTFSVLSEKPDRLPPSITIQKPVLKEGETAKLYAPKISIAGVVTDKNDIKEITVAGTIVELLNTVDSGGMRSKKFSAVPTLAVVGANDITITATDGRGNTATTLFRVQRLSKENALEILSPKDISETDQITLPVEFKTWFECSRYTIFHNTIEIVNKESIPRKPIGATINETISLSAGFNQILLTVYGKSGEKISKTFTVNRRVMNVPISSDAGKLPRNTNQPQQWAVIVGISEYQNPQIKNLSYADRDARVFAEFLQSSAGGGFDPNRMKVLLNKDATLQNIKSALNSFLRQTIEKDLVIIYFAGHGAPEPANPNNNYLLPYDTDPNSLETSAFPMWDVNTALTRYIPSKKVVVFTDACHSGGISSDIATRGMTLTETNLINQYLSDLSKSKEGTIVFTASQAGEVSQELDKFGHGVFTYFLLEGMKGKADFNNDYTVTIGELMDYVEEKVKRQTNGNQHPTRNQGSYDKDLTISLIPH